jgi:hypothetical protein
MSSVGKPCLEATCDLPPFEGQVLVRAPTSPIRCTFLLTHPPTPCTSQHVTVNNIAASWEACKGFHSQNEAKASITIDLTVERTLLDTNTRQDGNLIEHSASLSIGTTT